MARGRFIVFEGVDGSGKTTMSRCFYEHLKALAARDRRPEPILTREPGGCPLSEHLRELLLFRAYPMSPMTEVLMFSTARHAHIDQVIEPKLAAGHDVICDRWQWSTVSYQSYGGQLDRDMVLSILRPTAYLKVDHCYWFDLDPMIGLKRISDRAFQAGNKDVDFFHGRPREFYQNVAQGYNWCAHNNPLDVCKEVVHINAAGAMASLKESMVDHAEALHQNV